MRHAISRLTDTLLPYARALGLVLLVGAGLLIILGLASLALLLLALCAIPVWLATRQSKTPDSDTPEQTDLRSCSLASHHPDLVWQIDASTRCVTRLNQQLPFAHPDPEHGSQRLADLLPGHAARQFMEALITLQSDEQHPRFEYRLEQEGRQATFEARLLLLPDRHAIALIRDISAVKATEEALLNQQLFTHQIIEASPALVFVRDAHGRFLLVNRATQATLGHDLLVQSHMGMERSELPFGTGDDQVLEHGQSIRLLEQWTLSNGQTHWFDITKQPLQRDDGVYILNIAIDITKLKASEDSLNRGDSLLHALAEALPHPILLVENQQIEFANVAACAALQRRPEQLINQPLTDLASNAETLLLSTDSTLQSQLQEHNGNSHPCSVHHLNGNNASSRLIVLSTTQPA